ncbi:bifunctional glutamate N-acetyltransferase/amino-acid acetyltransferase ArgJ [Pseudooceanicola sp. CBS1P-1]|uniref:Arginine biosynthesis bifunctional protein ArgJ n=1 Tax=Pseudooceanicola albus TaxID=2692189 RepID=A0A6L7G294_9RHOB|nr:MULTISPECIES: bifunctional glutamate N-acetyltransferase/amino-acid acetyltransferase ArgJ [Pseudooceanicola]MBT9383884.1 bifunctional glutamate N-acetyltransferase/amino-acid acetyltransferase ArgJ [Pseudooceanicola endophyticus]MXN16703.1 bifunctional glutamate N-acetyltransferase/amino-acid acetyltransferase ArgJ [Pseudooceanicola albus]
MAGKYPTSPLAPAAFPELPVIGGLRFASAAAGVKYQGRTDVMLALLDPGSTMAGVFTRSKTRSAPVLDCQAKIGLDGTGGAAIIVNSGNSNAFTGKNGIESTRAVTTATAAMLGLEETRVFSSSTGVIGEPLKHERITAKLEELKANLAPGKIAEAANAIMTTDTFPKGAAAEVALPGGSVKIAGIAKGSGMIAPDMATMLVYIFTDAKIERAVLQGMLSSLTDVTFNCITVDSDTSTSDTLLMGATGASGVTVTADDTAFVDALKTVMLDLSHQVVKDGEGATKFVEITVTGAVSDAEAKVHAMAIANSPLIKTAVAGEDPNWGRVVMAIGKSGAEADRDLLTITFDDVLVAEKGWVSPSYSEDQGAAVMKQQEIRIGVDLGLGAGKSTVWTCDLTHGYISINADYRS